MSDKILLRGCTPLIQYLDENCTHFIIKTNDIPEGLLEEFSQQGYSTALIQKEDSLQKEVEYIVRKQIAIHSLETSFDKVPYTYHATGRVFK